jgi:hypothetical protein
VKKLLRASFAVFVLLTLSLFPIQRAQAETTFSDAVIVVSVGTVSGAILGASTLPFYNEPGSHTKNIFYGAALGAMIGVFFSAYAGVKDNPGPEDAFLERKPSTISLNEAPELRLHAASSVAMRPASASETPIAWSPIARLRF